MKSGILACVLLATIWNGAALAQGAPIKLADVAELSGGGATVGTNWKNGIDLAVEEINAKGGILGRKLEVTHADSQSNPGVARAQVQKALDGEPYVLLGPGYSGSVKVTAPLAAEAGIAQIMGGEAAELTQGGNKFLFRTSFGQQSSMPKVAKYIHDEVKAKSVAIVWVNWSARPRGPVETQESLAERERFVAAMAKPMSVFRRASAVNGGRRPVSARLMKHQIFFERVTADFPVRCVAMN